MASTDVGQLEVCLPSKKPPVDISSLTVTNVLSQADFDAAIDLRWRAYGKHYPNDFKTQEDATDKFDTAGNCVLLLAKDSCGTPVGSLRVLNHNYGSIELDTYINIRGIVNNYKNNAAEFTRFSVPSNADSKIIKLALLRAGFQLCQDNQIPTMIAWVKDSAKRLYDSLFFQSIGDAGVFAHAKLGGKRHTTMLIDLPSVMRKYCESHHPLYKFFCLEKHSNIDVGLITEPIHSA
jgi:hypothetical protein